MRIVALLISVLVAVTLAERASYDGSRVYRVFPSTQTQIDALRQLEESGQYSFWTDVNKLDLPVDVLVHPHMRSQFHEAMTELNIRHDISIPDVQTLIDSEKQQVMRRAKSVEWTNYHDLNEIYSWLEQLASEFSIVKVVNAGQTYEGRDLKAIEIFNGEGLPGLILEAGIHAREWIGPASTSFMINEILKSAADSVWRKFNYIYIPSANPDGYVFTWENDRLWRKTRKPYKQGLLTCYGADPNRNFDSHWMEGGSSGNPCSDTHAGSEAFSEIETKSLAEYLTSVSKNYDLYISYHSYSQLLMFPWGYTSSHAPLHDHWQRIGDLAAEALRKVHGTVFQVGNIYDTIYQVSGTSLEWYYDKFNSSITYTYETRDTGRYGFVLPPEQIIPVGEEHLASLEEILHQYLMLQI